MPPFNPIPASPAKQETVPIFLLSSLEDGETLVMTTFSGNEYRISRAPEGKLLIINIRDNPGKKNDELTGVYLISSLVDASIIKGKVFSFGGAVTTEVMSLKKIKEEDKTSLEEVIEPVLDSDTRSKLKALHIELSVSGSLFGRDVVVGEEVKEKIRLVADIIEKDLQYIDLDPNWKDFLKTIQEKSNTGEILSFIFPPNWLVNGGDIKNVNYAWSKDKGGQITVPEYVYTIYLLKEVVTSLRNEPYDPGTMTKYLDEKLVMASQYLKERKLI